MCELSGGTVCSCYSICIRKYAGLHPVIYVWGGGGGGGGEGKVKISNMIIVIEAHHLQTLILMLCYPCENP